MTEPSPITHLVFRGPSNTVAAALNAARTAGYTANEIVDPWREQPDLPADHALIELTDVPDHYDGPDQRLVHAQAILATVDWQLRSYGI